MKDLGEQLEGTSFHRFSKPSY